MSGNAFGDAGGGAGRCRAEAGGGVRRGNRDPVDRAVACASGGSQTIERRGGGLVAVENRGYTRGGKPLGHRRGWSLIARRGCASGAITATFRSACRAVGGDQRDGRRRARHHDVGHHVLGPMTDICCQAGHEHADFHPGEHRWRPGARAGDETADRSSSSPAWSQGAPSAAAGFRPTSGRAGQGALCRHGPEVHASIRRAPGGRRGVTTSACIHSAGRWSVQREGSSAISVRSSRDVGAPGRDRRTQDTSFRPG